MKLLKKINENTSCGSVATAMMPLFGSLVNKPAPDIDTKNIKIIKFKKPANNTHLKHYMVGLMKEAMDPASHQPELNNDETIAKLKSLENKSSTDTRDTVTYGLEDDKGNVVKVLIKREEAPEFEHALHSIIDKNNDNQHLEIAEILFNLKDSFTIVNVEWPEVEEDEEIDQNLELGTSDQTNTDTSDDLPMVDVEQNKVDVSTEPVKDLLTQVIDMMKADAEARKADAEARSAEAKSKEAELATQQALLKVKREEQILDMEIYNKNQKEAEREAKRLAQLAKWKHDVAKDNSDTLEWNSSEENEEISKYKKPTSNIRNKIHPHDIAQFLLKRIK